MFNSSYIRFKVCSMNILVLRFNIGSVLFTSVIAFLCLPHVFSATYYVFLWLARKFSPLETILSSKLSPVQRRRGAVDFHAFVKLFV